MLFVDIAIRGAAIGMLFLLAGLLWRAPIGWEGRISIVAVALAKSAFLVIHAPAAFDLPPAISANLILFASLVPNAITWLIVTIFLDAPGRRWPWLVASSIVSAILYLDLSFPQLALGAICAACAMLLYGALFGLALWTSRDDLVERRCRARPGFAAAIAGLGLVLTMLQVLGVAQPGSMPLALTQSGGTFAVTLGFAIWILTPNMDLWPGQAETPSAPRPAPDPGPDRAMIQRISTAMAAGAWREEGLTIGGLANQLGVPEHRLRRAINGGLGYRNFSSFINAHRITEAKAMLSDPDATGTTVLEIAYAVGFASLGPFNRAFRAETGQSPTEFRRAAPQIPRADSGQSTPIPANLH
ncbi:helix-turn-helix domain-containing protein [Gymnodinialimonas sp. 2305UL16-5]|uniref:helix-turn-helix domain-containing protein n=1 Tax=Gymnodinialimonas mytili TaxID=3126503 RepID=UPI0030A67826